MAVFSDSVKWVPCVSSIRDNLPMGRRPLEVGQLQPLLAERINDVASELGVSGRALAEQIGVGKDRVLAVLASNQAMTVNELDAMCRALGLTASEVVREAEEAVARAEGSTVVDVSADERSDGMGRVVPLRPAKADDVPEPVWERMAAKMHPGRAREIAERTGWREDLGEESQVNPGWEE